MYENNAVGIALAVIRRHHGEAKHQSSEDAGDGDRCDPWIYTARETQKSRRISKEMNADAEFHLTCGHNVPCYALLQSHPECRRAGPGSEREGHKETASKNKQISACAQAEYRALHRANAKY